MTPSENERLAVVESQMRDVKASQVRIEEKLDAAIECKADRSEVDSIAAALRTKADAADLKAVIEKKANAEDFKELRQLLLGVLLSIAGTIALLLLYIILRASGVQF